METDVKNCVKSPESFLEWIRTHFPQAGGFVDLSVRQELFNIGDIPDADGYGKICGICGDTMEIWLKIENGIITDARYLTDGCFSSQICGSAATFLAKNEPLMGALDISPKRIMDLMELIPGVDVHCSILATSTLYRAIAEYILNVEKQAVEAQLENASRNDMEAS